MCIMADFYGIHSLNTFARQQLNNTVKGHWDSQDFVDTLNLVCNPPLERDEKLQEIIRKTITEHPSLLDKPDIEAILNQKPSLTFALLKQLHRKTASQRGWPR